MGKQHKTKHVFSFFSKHICCIKPPRIREAVAYYPTTISSASSSSSCSSCPASTKSDKNSCRGLSSVTFEPPSPRVGCYGRVGGMTSLQSSLLIKPSGKGSIAASNPPKKCSRIKRAISGRPWARPSMAVVDIRKLDPPLPAVKQPAKDKKPVSLWKRRCAGGSLKKICLKQQPSH